MRFKPIKVSKLVVSANAHCPINHHPVILVSYGIQKCMLDLSWVITDKIKLVPVGMSHVNKEVLTFFHWGYHIMQINQQVEQNFRSKSAHKWQMINQRTKKRRDLDSECPYTSGPLFVQLNLWLGILLIRCLPLMCLIMHYPQPTRRPIN